MVGGGWDGMDMDGDEDEDGDRTTLPVPHVVPSDLLLSSAQSCTVLAASSGKGNLQLERFGSPL